MANKTNCTINGKAYFKIKRKVGMKKNKQGDWVADYKLFYGKNEKEAKQKYDDFMKRESVDSSKCLGELIDWYVDNVFMLDSSFSDGTKSLYINSYHLVFDQTKIVGKSLFEISGAEIQSALTINKRKATTVHQAVKFIRLFYKYLESQHIATDITHGLVLPKVESKSETQDVEIFEDWEIKRFINNTPTDHRLRLLVVLAINTGARIGELLALTYEDLKNNEMRINKQLVEIEKIKTDPDSKVHVEVSDTKTRASIRTIPLNEEVNQAITAHKHWHNKEMLKNGYRTNYVFTTASGNLYYKSTVRTSFKRLCKTIKIEPRGFHTFRHTFGSKLANAGVPIQTVSKLMGHNGINVTSKYYIHISTDEKKTAIKALKFA